MKFLIFALACIVAVQAVSRVPRGAYNAGGRYGNSGYGSGQGGSYNNGGRAGGAAGGHNVNHVEDDFNTATNHHHQEDHNAGGKVTYGQGGHSNGAYNGHEHGHNNYGGGYRSGITG